MRSAYARWLLVAALSTAGSAVVSGCANDQETVNRVQPNALEKSALDGEWYYLQTVIDTPATSSFTFVGDQGDVKKIRWEVQEDYLIARRIFENIDGAEVAADTENDAANTALAMYKITSHFDIRRDYNPATGEQTNVVSENTVDRPWYQREFMRVDWSENLITDGQFMLIQRVLDGIQTEAASYFVQDGEDAPQFVKGEDGTVNYVDIVNKMFVKPTTVKIPDFGEIPTCLLSGTIDICEAGEISVRNSFRKVVDTDFEPKLYTGDRMERFGFFVHERMGYSKDYGNIENERYRFAERHNLWQKSHRRNEEGKLLSCTAHSQCSKDVKGSRCDTDWGRAKRRFNTEGEPLGVCTIPYREREVRPIVYYANNLPDELAVDIESIGAEWNKAFVETVSSLRENECLDAGGKAADCAAERKRADHQKMFYLCQAPVQKGAPEICGEEGFKPKPGDLRYSQLFWVKGEEGGGPLGYGPGHSDPETGETLMGNAFVYGAGVERYAARARDIVMLLNGDLTTEQLQAGDYIKGFAEAAHARNEPTGSGSAVSVTPESMARAAQSMTFGRGNPDHIRSTPKNVAELKAAITAARNKLYAEGQYGNGVDEAKGRLARLKGTDIEAMMVTPENRLAAGLDPFAHDMGEEVLNAASPLRGQSVDTIRAVERARNLLREKVGYYDADFQDEGLVGLALEIQRQADKGGKIEWYGRQYEVGSKGKVNYEQIRVMVQHPMFHGLALHEIGHSIGLRHNFSGSFDALNYHKQYWNLRNDGNMAPRLWDKPSPKEINGRIREYQYSTVMDYGNNFVVSDAVGIGKYDVAAIKMGYGDLVEVFSEGDAATHAKVAGVSAIVRLGYPIMLDLTSSTPRSYVYTDWPELVGGIGNLEKRADVAYESLKPDAELGRQGLTDPAVDAKGRAAVPYLFCSDETANLNPDCTLYDAGADPQESIQSTIDAYWYYYAYTNFRRQRVGFSVGPVVNAVLNRYFDKLKSAHQINALYVPIFKDIFNLTDDAPFWTDKNGMGAWTAASLAGYELLQHVITSPEPGGYATSTRPDGTKVMVPETQPLFTEATVDSLDGRFLETTYDFDAGYFWFDQLDRVGYFHDKVMALVTLVDPTTYFVGRDTDADIRRYQINYGTTFGSPMKSFFRALVAEDWAAIAPRISGSGDATTLAYPALDQIEKRNMAGTPVSPNVSFSIQLYAAIYGMGYIPQTYDQSFLNSSRVWAVGGAEEVSVDPTKTLVTFVDPDSGITYAAVSELDAEGVEQGVGASVLTYANALFAAGLGADALPGTEDDDVVALDTARKYVDNVDILRRLTWQLGFGAQP